MIKKATEYTIRVAFSYKMSTSNETLSTTKVYNIVAKYKSEACDIARELNKAESYKYIDYRYLGLAVPIKKEVYVLIDSI